ncbi:hypothetical protein [Rhodoferax sp.]|uniref:hypothetical protein n=1 Tax=Rhodoferax sp. TaxID=50421 RepID=UPI00284B6B84|nr:hypothetical protein [Rhodoferax sp.]MDR3367982.1 hypothetical protein [Rhodoferax sp.]
MTIEYQDSSVESLLTLEDMPAEQFVEQVYASATPPERDDMVSLLVGQVYQAAPPSVRGALIKYLMQPLGALSLLSIANGVFAGIRFQGGFYNPQIRLEDLQGVRVEDVVALTHRVQQVSLHALNGLAHLLASSPTLASSVVAMVLIKILSDRAKIYHDDDSRIRSVPHFPERRTHPV